MVMQTKEMIMVKSLEMFARGGYDSVSIRDIAKAVNIKESSIYYHFENKQDVLNSILTGYEQHIQKLTEVLTEEIAECNRSSRYSLLPLKETYFQQFLLDPFCNQVMRLLMIEQLKDEKIHVLYDHYLFKLPQKIQKEAFSALVEKGMLSEVNAERMQRELFDSITALTFEYLLSGEPDEEKNRMFLKMAEDCLEMISKEGQSNG